MFATPQFNYAFRQTGLVFCKCHRYEPAGTMHGLMRVRGFVQDDAHIFCTEDQIASEVADFCALVKESVQAECHDKMLAFWHDRGAAADAKGVKSTTTIQEPSVATGCLQTVITEAKREALAPFGFDDIVVKFSTRPE